MPTRDRFSQRRTGTAAASWLASTSMSEDKIAFTIALLAVEDPTLLSATDIQALGRAFVAHESVQRDRTAAHQ